MLASGEAYANINKAHNNWPISANGVNNVFEPHEIGAFLPANSVRKIGAAKAVMAVYAGGNLIAKRQLTAKIVRASIFGRRRYATGTHHGEPNLVCIMPRFNIGARLMSYQR